MFFLLLLFLLPFRLVKSLARKPSVVLEVCTRAVGFSLSLSVPSFLVFLFFCSGGTFLEENYKKARSLLFLFIYFFLNFRVCGWLVSSDLNARLIFYSME